MKNKNTLSEQELKFVHEYVSNGFLGKPAYKAAFNIEDDTKANTGAYRLLKKQVIQDAIDSEEGSYKALAREMAMDRKEILDELKKVIWGKTTVVTKAGLPIDVENDGKTKIAAINTLVKLTGDFSPERQEIEFSTDKKIDTKNMSKEEIEELQTALLREM